MAAVQVYYQESKEEVRTETRSSGPNPAPDTKPDELESLLSELNSSRYTGIVDRSSGAMTQPLSAGRPSVDYLLNELNSVNSTSRTTTNQHHAPSNHVATNNPPLTASTATRDLDDLMAELSDFKLGRTDTYAKPQKPRSPSPAPPPPPPVVKSPSPPAVNELDCMLGSLTTHMTEQGVNTSNKGSCCACDKPIVGQVITALGKTWHPEHFKCGHCKQELGAKNFFERDGQPYCESCYHDLFSPRCAYCDGSILDKCVTALDKNWHPDHFFCAQCGNTFGEEGFHEKDGKAYCREDYYNMFAPKCGGCNSPIMENYISALNTQWHPECFVCRDCKKPVTGKSYYAMENKPVCAACVGVSDDEEDGEEEED